MNAKTQKPISEMTTAEMVAEYNKLTDKSIKKFSSRAAGEKQLAKAREFMVVAKAVVEGAASVKEDERKGQDRRATDRRHEPAKVVVTSPGLRNPGDVFGSALDAAKNSKPDATLADKKSPAPSATRSQGISESWNNPDVAAKRAQRHNVKVVLDGKEKGVFRSTLEAFKKLNLPQSGHIKFRMALKAAGQKEFVSGKHTYQFSLVEQKELPLTK